MLETLAALPETLGTVSELVADAGYFSAANVAAYVEANIDPMLAAGRESHHLHWLDRFTEPPPLSEPADAVERMRHRLKTGDRARIVRDAQADRRASLRNHQSGDAISAISAARVRGRSRGVVLGDDGVEHPSDGGAEGLKTG